MFKPNRQIYREAKTEEEKKPWIIPDNERIVYGIEQELEGGIADIIGQQGVTSELVRGALGGVAKTVEVVEDAAYPLVEVANQTRLAYKDWRVGAIGALAEENKMEAIKYGAKGFGRILISPLIGIYKWPKRLLQMLYDTGRAVEDLSGFDFKTDTEHGFMIKMGDKGLVRAGWSLLKGVGKILKAPFVPIAKKLNKMKEEKEEEVEAPKPEKKKPEESKKKEKESEGEEEEEEKMAA